MHTFTSKGTILFRQSLFFRPAALPAVAPVTNQELEAERVNSKTWLKTDAQVAVVHLVLVDISVQQAQMTGDGEEEVVVPRGKARQLILEQLGHFSSPCTLFTDFGLDAFWQDLGRKISQPGLKHASNDIDVVKIWLIEQVNVVLSVEALLPLLDLMGCSGNSVEAFFLTSTEVEIAI